MNKKLKQKNSYNKYYINNSIGTFKPSIVTQATATTLKCIDSGSSLRKGK
jgi:hypothetical protein